MKGHHYIIAILFLSIGAWYAVKRGWLRKPVLSGGGAATGEQA